MEQPVKIVTISQQVYQILKTRICKGEYPPGYWRQEKELAAQLNVSRSPVREALRLLVADGIATEISNKGVFVKSFTQEDVEDIYEVRGALENGAIISLKDRLTQEEKERIKEYIRQMKKYHAESRLDDYIKQDTGFHRYIIECSSNRLMLTLYDKIGMMSMQFRVESLRAKKRFDDSITEHQKIADYLIENNMQKACDINSKHLQFARDQILEIMKNEKKNQSTVS